MKEYLNHILDVNEINGKKIFTRTRDGYTIVILNKTVIGGMYGEYNNVKWSHATPNWFCGYYKKISE